MYFVTSLLDRNFGRSNTIHLSCTYTDCHIICSQYNRIRLHMLNNFPTKQQLLQFFLCRFTVSNHFKIGIHQPSAHHSLERPYRRRWKSRQTDSYASPAKLQTAKFEQADIFLFRQDIQCFLRKAWCRYDLKENILQQIRRIFVNDPVSCNDSTKD